MIKRVAFQLLLAQMWGEGGGGIARMSMLRKTYHFSIAHEIDHHNSFLVISQLVYSLPQLFNDNFCWFITSL